VFEKVTAGHRIEHSNLLPEHSGLLHPKYSAILKKCYTWIRRSVMTTTFKPKPPVKEQFIDLTVSLPANHHAHLVAVGKKSEIPPEEVLKQFVAWAIETNQIGPKRRKKAK
jgi:hypothetical protein